jgi:pimeloyl-[acyl-carrier protein] methyl ester esterase
MSLHLESQGSGAPLLLIHGWGMHGGMWGQVAAQLATNYRVHSIDLPGHGHSKLPSPEIGRGGGGEGTCQDALSLTLSRERERGQVLLDEIVAQLSAQIDEPLTVCGWSLGGQVALRWAQLHPAQIEKLVLVATTPCFVQQQDWSCAMAAETLQDFAASLMQNHVQTLRRFLALQLRGSENERELLLDLRARLFANGEPDTAALRGGLEILRDTDMRHQLKQITQHALVIAGERDTLTPLAASEYMAKTLPNARLAVMQGAAHAPFLSHPQFFMQQLTSFLDE